MTTNDKIEKVPPLNIGLDFGTTYSIFATMKNDIPVCCSMNGEQGEDKFYDSVVLYNKQDNTLYYAIDARKKTGFPDTVSIRGFKLKLFADEELVVPKEVVDLLSSDGFVLPSVSENITKAYLKALFAQYKNKINRIVIGNPMVWDEMPEGSVARGTISSILKDLEIVKNKTDIKYLPEPHAACCYFVDRYRNYNENGQAYQGHVLVVDYGGGTLDIVLCKVSSNENKPFIETEKLISIEEKKAYQKINKNYILSEGPVVATAGAGENREGQIGQGGLAFMREVVRVILRENNVNEDIIKSMESDGCLDFAAFGLEDIFKRLSAGRSKYNDKFLRSFKELTKDKIDMEADKPVDRAVSICNEKLYIKYRYNGVTYEGYYSILTSSVAKAYRNTIYEVLERELNKIQGFIDIKGINTAYTNKNFKILLIGGFSNLYLVEQQIYRFFGIKVSSDQIDERMVGTFDHLTDERTKAVAFGAALKANGYTDVPVEHKFSIGLKDREVENTYYWAVEKGMPLEYNWKYLIKDKNGPFALFTGGLDRLEYIGPYMQNFRPIPTDKIKIKNNHYGYLMGISIDESESITFHTWELTREGILDCRETIEDSINNKEIGEIDILSGGEHQETPLGYLYNIGTTGSGVTNLLGGK